MATSDDAKVDGSEMAMASDPALWLEADPPLTLSLGRAELRLKRPVLADLFDAESQLAS